MNDRVERNRDGDLTFGTHVLKSFDIVPNSFLDLQQMNESNKVKVRLFNIQSNTIQKDEEVELEMINSVKNYVFLVVFGGWIPCAFIKKKTILLADRNVVTEIISRYKGGEKKGSEEPDSFDSIFLQNKNISLDISAYVIEGNERKIPTNKMIDQQVFSVKNSLKLALPNLEITTYSDDNSYYYNWKDGLEEGVKRRMVFLQEIAPKLNKQFTKKSRKKTVEIVFETAKKMQLNNNDIVIILALLRITMNGQKTAAQLVLKDSQIYTEENAYNAACDLSTIEMLINMHLQHEKMKLGYNIALITKDKGLSLFSSLFSNTAISGRSEGNLQITAKIMCSIFFDDDEDEDLQKIYENWFKGEL